MKTTMKALMIGVVMFAPIVCGCNKVSASICSDPATKSILQGLIQEKVADVLSLALPDDPFTFDMADSDIITLDESPYKTTCKILPQLINKTNPPKGDTLIGDDWFNYTVEKTDESNKIRVNMFIHPAIQEVLDEIKEKVKSEEREKLANTADASRSSTTDEGAKAFLKRFASNGGSSIEGGQPAKQLLDPP